MGGGLRCDMNRKYAMASVVVVGYEVLRDIMSRT